MSHLGTPSRASRTPGSTRKADAPLSSRSRPGEPPPAARAARHNLECVIHASHVAQLGPKFAPIASIRAARPQARKGLKPTGARAAAHGSPRANPRAPQPAEPQAPTPAQHPVQPATPQNAAPSVWPATSHGTSRTHRHHDAGSALGHIPPRPHQSAGPRRLQRARRTPPRGVLPARGSRGEPRPAPARPPTPPPTARPAGPAADRNRVVENAFSTRTVLQAARQKSMPKGFRPSHPRAAAVHSANAATAITGAAI